ncbi:MAG: TIGR03960 family B12-binding radical SAM protein [Acidobacteriota bacterium]
MSFRIEDILNDVEKPHRYLGNELNSIKKNPAKARIKIALSFPDLYEIGMSSLGIKILYFLLNGREDILAERVFSPGVDFERELRSRETPLFSLENKIPLRDFDIIGVSLLYELNFANMLNILNLAKIPLRSKDRDMDMPLIIAGGPSCFNPEPISPFIDLFLIGDGEEGVFEIIDNFFELKKTLKNDKSQILKELAKIDGVYVPSQWKEISDKKTGFIIPMSENNNRIRKRVLKNLDDYPFPEKIVVPSGKIVFDRISYEISRGCAQRCRFCQATSIYSPYRIRKPQSIVEGLLRLTESTGYEEVSLSSLNTADYPYLSELLKILMKIFSEERISISVSSLRPSGLKEEVSKEIVKVRKTGFTIVPEAGTDRLRKVINKELNDDEIVRAAENCFKFGWRLLKLYFMVGLPTEREEDLKGITDIVKNILRIGRRITGKDVKINLSVSSFIPKPHTPFQWLGMEEEKALIQKLHFIKDSLKKYKSVNFKNHSVKMSVIEALISRGDRYIGNLIERAWQYGAKLDAWSDFFRPDIWENAIHDSHVEKAKYLSPVPLDSPLPWDHIDTGIKKETLQSELKKAFNEEATFNCLDRRCNECFECDLWRIMKKYYKEKTLEQPELNLNYVGEKTEKEIRYLATYSKKDKAKYLSHLDLIRIFERGFRKSRISIVFSKGHHPHMLFSFPPPPPLGIECRNEVLEFKSSYLITSEEFKEAVKGNFPEGIEFNELYQMMDEKGKLSKEISGIIYSVNFRPTASEVVFREIYKLRSDEIFIVPDTQFSKLFITEKYSPAKSGNIMKKLIEIKKMLEGEFDEEIEIVREGILISNSSFRHSFPLLGK